MKFEIGIPTLNRADLLIPYVKVYKNKNFKDVTIHIIDNGNQDLSSLEIPGVKIYKEEKNIGVAASWNKLCKIIFQNNDNALILNDDVVVGYYKDDVNKMIDMHKGFLRATPDWCAFILNKKIYQQVGKFDEVFYPAYYEDSSYEYRMRLHNIKINKIPELNPFIYQSSKTMEKMPELLELSKRNKELYIKMWGGEPKKEKYKTPYNK